MSESTALAVLPAAQLPTILQAPEARDIFSALASELADYEPDISTKKGRDECASKARKVSVAKQDLLRIAKSLKDDALKTQRGINAEERVVVDRFDALRDQVREPLTQFENIEKDRVEAHRGALEAIEESPGWGPGETIADLRKRLDYLDNYPARDWQEFAVPAARRIASERERVIGLIAVAIQREEDEKAAAEALAKATAEREARIAQEAADKAKADAEAKAAREAQEAQEKADQALRDLDAARQREADAAARRERDAADALARSEQAKEAAEQAKVAAERKAERDKVEAEAKAKADADRAVEVERRRVAAEEAREKRAQEAREADQLHRAAFNREARDALIEAMADFHTGDIEEASRIATRLVTVIARGEIPHITIRY